MGPARPFFGVLALVAGLACLCLRVTTVHAQPAVSGGASVPELGPASSLGDLAGRPVTRIEVVTRGGRWERPVALRRVRLGDPLSGELARRALDELADSGRFADARAEVEPDGASGALLRLSVLPRRIITAIKIVGAPFADDEMLRAGGIDEGSEITAPELADFAERLRAFYARRGFPHAVVTPDAIDTDDELRVVIVLRVDAGAARIVGERIFHVLPGPSEALAAVLSDYDVDRGDRADDEAMSQADRDLEAALHKANYDLAEVSHRLTPTGERPLLDVDVRAGPHHRLIFEGNHRFDATELEDALELEDAEDRSPGTLASKLEKYYLERGFLDARVLTAVRGGPHDTENALVFSVHEGEIVEVIGREYPCLGGDRSANDVGGEIDSFLSEALPGTGFVGAVDPKVVDSAFGPTGNAGARVPPRENNPWRTYSPEVYERATRHLQELYRSEGYLSAIVGPFAAIRRACNPRSPPGQCIPMGPLVRPKVTCPVGGQLPLQDPPPSPSCTPDPRHGHACEPQIILQIPIKLGPRAILWDSIFEGNSVLVEKDLAGIAELDLGGPVSQVELDKARRRVLDEYEDRGFAFASVELRLELSPDKTRARARFIISERELVRVKDVVVRGARRTNESLVLSRVVLKRGDVYRRSDVRSTEERLATLGVFASVSVALEDPEVFAREKVVVVTVRERAPQYLDVRPGFSTGDGFRVTFEYGHRNLGGQAIKLTLRVQLGLLPDFLILEDDVRQRFQALPLDQRLERRDSISLEFPEVGLGPLFPLGVDLIDVRDNSRDFGLTKDAAITTLSYRPTTRFVTQIGGSLELNDARIFAGDETIADYIAQNPGTSLRLRVPDGKTYAIAERTSVSWDRRDNPFDATSGTFASAGVEHVHAAPADSSANITSDFLRLTGRLAGYLRLSDRGLALAISMRGGYNVQLREGSQTYPDRLFFFGGVDSIRGFLQDSVIPQDIAERIIRDRGRAGQPGVEDSQLLTADKVPIRGGDVLLNPRAELRIPLSGIFQTALFLDAGNVWLDPGSVRPYILRYAAGTGLRATTPVGPLALDFGINLDRRAWEDPFAFHFSIGLF
jgi:outer membrane protein assembly factor BamA